MGNPRQENEVLVLPEGVAAFRAANKVLKQFGVILKWRSDRKNVGDQVYLHAERISADPAVMEGLKPKVGDKIYVPTQMSIDHGENDIRGGLATISKVQESVFGGKSIWFVEVSELPGIFGRSWNYEVLLQDQAKLKKEYGKQKARPDPDYG